MGSGAMKEIEVREGETARVDLVWRDILLTGKVTRGGVPLPNVRLASGGMGGVMGAMPLHGITVKLANNHSDRVYLANDACVIQCLRDIDARSPTLYVPPPLEIQDKPKIKSPADAPKKDSTEKLDAAEATDDAVMPEENAEPAADDAVDPFK